MSAGDNDNVDDQVAPSALWRWVEPAILQLSTLLERHRWARTLVATIKLFDSTNCAGRSAEIAYYAILSTIPLTALFLLALSIGTELLVESGWTLNEIEAKVVEVVAMYLPVTPFNIDELLTLLMQSGGTFGLVGALSLLVTASLVFGAVSRALAAIFDVKSRDRFTTTMLFTVGLCAVVVLVVLGLPLVGAIASVIDTVVPGGGTLLSAVWIQVVADTLLGLAFLFLLVAVARVRTSQTVAWACAALFVGLFELARFAFTLYLSYLAKMHVVYGSVAGVITVIIWVYYVAFVLMLCMCLLRVTAFRLDESRLGTLLNPEEPASG